MDDRRSQRSASVASKTLSKQSIGVRSTGQGLNASALKAMNAGVDRAS